MMTFEEAKELLSKADREELRDHAFGDREVYWNLNGMEVAYGYFGTTSDMSIYAPESGNFQGKQAYELGKCGKTCRIERNDETGPLNYQDGKIMSTLTLEGVRKEIERG